jgi:hypothetical protein
MIKEKKKRLTSNKKKLLIFLEKLKSKNDEIITSK